MTRRLQELYPWLGGILALLIVIGIWHWLSTNFERRTEVVATGWSAEARRNPYLAAEQFLSRLGMDATSVAGRAPLRDLPAPEDTMIVRGLGPMHAERINRIQDWIEQGGILVVEAMSVTTTGAGPRRKGLLAALGAVLREADEADGHPGGARVIASLDAASLDAGAAVAANGPIEIAFSSRYSLQDLSGDAEIVVDANGLPRMLRYQLGDGQVIVLSDSVFMTNEQIGQHDHALFTALLAGRGNGRVWLLYDSEVPALPALVWEKAPQAVLAAATLLILLLWHLGGRLGPLLPEQPRRRRDLLLHLDAAAELLWRHGLGDRQLAATRRRVEQAWACRHPQLRGLSAAARVRWIADQTGLDVDAIDAALYRDLGSDDDGALIQATQTLQQLWLAR